MTSSYYHCRKFLETLFVAFAVVSISASVAAEMGVHRDEDLLQQQHQLDRLQDDNESIEYPRLDGDVDDDVTMATTSSTQASQRQRTRYSEFLLYLL